MGTLRSYQMYSIFGLKRIWQACISRAEAKVKGDSGSPCYIPLCNLEGDELGSLVMTEVIGSTYKEFMN